jgi:hypothetical protein
MPEEHAAMARELERVTQRWNHGPKFFLAVFSADYLPAQAGKGAARLLYIPASSLIGRAICGRVIHWKHKAESHYPILSGTSWRASTMSRQAA